MPSRHIVTRLKANRSCASDMEDLGAVRALRADPLDLCNQTHELENAMGVRGMSAVDAGILLEVGAETL